MIPPRRLTSDCRVQKVMGDSQKRRREQDAKRADYIVESVKSRNGEGEKMERVTEKAESPEASLPLCSLPPKGRWRKEGGEERRRDNMQMDGVERIKQLVLISRLFTPIQGSLSQQKCARSRLEAMCCKQIDTDYWQRSRWIMKARRPRSIRKCTINEEGVEKNQPEQTGQK